jgi:hypothetical protein
MSEDAEVRARLETRRLLEEAAEVEAIRQEIAAERAEEQRLAKARAEVEDARRSAAEVRAEASAVGTEVAELLVALSEKVRKLAALKSWVERHAHVEAWHSVNTFNGAEPVTIDRVMPVSTMAASLALRIGRELSTIGGTNVDHDQFRADQASWEKLLDGQQQH